MNQSLKAKNFSINDIVKGTGICARDIRKYAGRSLSNLEFDRTFLKVPDSPSVDIILNRLKELSSTLDRPLRSADLSGQLKTHIYRKIGSVRDACNLAEVKYLEDLEISQLIFNAIEKDFNIEIEREVKFVWTKSEKGNYYRYDGRIKGYNVLLEVDGISHHKNVYNRPDFSVIQNRDLIKTKLAQEHGFTLVRIDLPFNKAITWELLNKVLAVNIKGSSEDPYDNIYIKKLV
jgi:hypothetical protein